jgi:hypothetical protein
MLNKYKFIFLFILFFQSSFLFAADRVQMAQSKINSSLSSILPKTDFLVIVNKLDQLDDLGASENSGGAIKILPGLNMGVDSRGTLIAQNQNSNNYQGAISVTLLIDKQVKQETFKTIEKLLPELIGGARDDDEFKISQSSLRQKNIDNPASSPQISIQNHLPENKNNLQEQFKFLAVLLVLGGLFFLLITRLISNSNKASSQDSSSKKSFKDSSSQSKNEPLSKNALKAQKAAFTILDAEAVSLFLLKNLKDKKNLSLFNAWLSATGSEHQRNVYKTLPSWVLSFFQERETIYKSNSEESNEKIKTEDLFEMITLVEQSLKTKNQKNKAFLMWFPAEALRYIPEQAQSTMSKSSKQVLWSLRPDMGDFVRMEKVDVNSLSNDLKVEEVNLCFNEMVSWSSKLIESNLSYNSDASELSRWTSYISSLNEFSPIESQLEQAKLNLSSSDYEQLIKTVAHLNTPFTLDISDRKNWLRLIEPDDYSWWKNLIQAEIPWDLKNDLRPIRYTMITQALEDKKYLTWTEKQKKDSAQRIIMNLRIALNKENSNFNNAA